MVLNLIFPVCMMNECIIMIKIHWTQGFMEIDLRRKESYRSFTLQIVRILTRRREVALWLFSLFRWVLNCDLCNVSRMPHNLF